MKEVRIVAATGMLGTGFLEETTEEGVAMKPMPSVRLWHDGSRALLSGSRRVHASKKAVKRDLRLMILCGIEVGDPGSGRVRGDGGRQAPRRLDGGDRKGNRQGRKSPFQARRHPGRTG